MMKSDFRAQFDKLMASHADYCMTLPAKESMNEAATVMTCLLSGLIRMVTILEEGDLDKVQAGINKLITNTINDIKKETSHAE